MKAQPINKNIEKQIYQIFYQVVADVKSPEEVELLFKALMTEAEIMTIAKRLAIAVFLDKGQSYSKIRDLLKVSSATIASVAESMSKVGMKRAIVRVKAEEWADMWSIKISRALEKLLK